MTQPHLEPDVQPDLEPGAPDVVGFATADVDTGAARDDPSTTVVPAGLPRVWRSPLPWLGLPVAVAGWFVPSMVDDAYLLGVAVDGLLLGMLALAIGFLVHSCGMVSLGHGAFYGLAAYTVAIGTSRWGWSITGAALAAVLATTVFAALVGAVVVRVPGISFAVITLAISQALYVLALQASVREWTNGLDGLGVRFNGDVLGWGAGEFGSADTVWPVVWVAVVAAVAIVWSVRRSRWGLALEAIRENEERARFSGMGTYVPRVAAFTLSGFLAAIAGVLFALHDAFVSPQALHWSTSANALVAAIVGGAGTLLGPVFGGVLYVWARDEFASSGDIQLYTGIALVAVLVLAPSGIVGVLAHRLRRLVRTRGAAPGGAA